MNTGIEKINVSVLIFTLNEEINLPFCLESLDWCDDINVVDSFSNDKTEVIARKYGARFYQNKFEGFGSQRNWALDNIDFKYPWILILDADERVPKELAQEMGDIACENPFDTGAFRVRRRFYMWGRWLRYSSLYPNWVVRFIHKDRVRYINRGHSETQQVEGKTESLKNDLIDENHKGISEWYERQNIYSTREAEYELQEDNTPVSLRMFMSNDPLNRRFALKSIARQLPFRPFIYFIYSYLFRKGFLEGRDGLAFCLMKARYQKMIVTKKYKLRLQEKHK